MWTVKNEMVDYKTCGSCFLLRDYTIQREQYTFPFLPPILATHYTVATQAACQTNGMVETDSILFFKFSLAVFRVGSFLFGSCDKVAFVVFLSNVCIYRKTSTGCVLSAKEKTQVKQERVFWVDPEFHHAGQLQNFQIHQPHNAASSSVQI